MGMRVEAMRGHAGRHPSYAMHRREPSSHVDHAIMPLLDVMFHRWAGDSHRWNAHTMPLADVTIE